jgi:hypothetical protein
LSLGGVPSRRHPSERIATDLDEKATEYLANGAAEVWLIYPGKSHAWVYEASGAARLESRSIHTYLLRDVDIPFSAIGLRPVDAPYRQLVQRYR